MAWSGAVATRLARRATLTSKDFFTIPLSKEFFTVPLSKDFCIIPYSKDVITIPLSRGSPLLRIMFVVV